MVLELDSGDLPDSREHFGFRDGIARTAIEGFDEGPDLVAPGEFVLGHPNAYGQLARSGRSAVRRPARRLRGADAAEVISASTAATWCFAN